LTTAVRKGAFNCHCSAV